MRKRELALKISFFLAFILLILYHAWNLLEINQKVERAIKEYVSSAFQNELKINRVSLSFGKVLLNDIRYTSPSGNFSVWIDDGSFDFDLKTFITRGFRLQKTDNHILLNTPRLTLSVSQEASGKESLERLGLTSAFQPLFQSISELSSFLQVLDINNGEVYVKWMPEEGAEKVVDSINGWIKMDNEGTAVLNVNGSCEAGDRNLFISSNFDYARGWLDSLIISLTGVQLRNARTGLVKLPLLDLQGGSLSGKLKIASSHRDEGFELSGRLRVSDARIQVPTAGISVERADISARLGDNELHIEQGRFLLNGSETELSGTLKNILHPQFDLLMHAPAFDFTRFLHTFTPDKKVPIEGVGDLQVFIKQTAANPRVYGTFAADWMRVAGLELDDIKFAMSFLNSVYGIDEFRANSNQCALNGWGRINFGPASTRISASFVTEGDFAATLNSLSPIKIRRADGMAVVNISGFLDAPEVTGHYAFALSEKHDETLALQGRFKISDWNLQFESASQDNAFRVRGIIKNIDAVPEYSVKIWNLPRVAGVFKSPLLNAFASRYSLDAELNGTRSDMVLGLEGRATAKGTLDFSSKFTVKTQSKTSRLIEGAIRLYPEVNNWFSTSFTAVYTDTSLEFTKLGNERWMTGNLKIGLKGSQKLSGSVKFQNVQLERLVEKNEAGVSKMAGKGYGEIKFGGSLHEPEIVLSGWMMDGYLYGLGVFRADMYAEIENDILQLTKFELTRNDQRFIQSQGKFDFKSGQADFQISSSNLEAGDLIHAISGKDSIITGNTSVALRLQGKTWPLPVYGYVKVRHGKALWFDFDELDFNLGTPDAPTGSTLGSDGFYAGDIAYIKNGRFVARGDGLFPLNKQDSMKVSLSGTGNFLSLLGDIATIVQKTSGIGSLQLSLVGPYGSVRLGPSALKIMNGDLRLSQVARHIEDLSADIVTEGRFIHVKDISGKIDNGRFWVRNLRRTETENNRPAEPLMIKSDWMNLGVLEMKSGKNGLPLHIPGIMESGEIGRFVFKGQEEKRQTGPNGEDEIIREKSKYGFIIAGPWKHPLVRGEVLLNYVNVTYPFILSDDPPHPAVVNLLMNADWDVVATAGKDNNYIRNINYGISSVYVNIGIDDNFSQLHFTGIARDTSSYNPGAVELLLAPRALPGGRVADPASARAIAADNGYQPRPSYSSLTRERIEMTSPEDTSSFRIVGSVESTRGTIDYLDLSFRVDKFGAVWDKSELQPILYGKAWTTVPDSLNYTQNVYLTMYARDPETGAKSNRGRFEDIYFDIESDSPLELPDYRHSKMTLLAALGVPFNDMRGQATEILTSSTDKVLFQQLLRPVERRLEKTLGLDVVRFNSRFTRNFLEMNQSRTQSEHALALLRSTRLTLGKYLSSNIYLLYTGQVATWPLNYRYTEPNIGLRHTFGFEYRINPTLLLQMEYDYNSVLAEKWREDKKIWIRHSFPF